MKNKKRLLALALSALMLVPTPAAYAAEISGEGQTEGVSGKEQTDQTPDGAQKGFTVDEDGVLTAYSGAGGEITIPETVKSIGREAFKGNDSLTKVIFQNGVTEIKADAFRECANLEEVILSDGLEKIEMNAFRGCTSLAEIEFPTSVTMIADGAFSDCSALKNIIFGLKGEGQNEYSVNRSFQNCTSLQTVTIPAGVGIRGDSFSGCTSLTEFKVSGDGVYMVSDGCLYLKNWEGNPTTFLAFPAGKKEVKFLETVTEIGEAAFADCLSITSVEIPDTVTKIGDCAFDYCKNLNKVTLSKNLKEMGSYVFRGCSFSEIDIPETLESIPSSAFRECKELKKVTIPGSVKSLNGNVFEDCIKLESVFLQEGVQSISDKCFRNCYGLETIVIPESVTFISPIETFSVVGDYERKVLTIYGKAGSTAEQYAKENYIKFSTGNPPEEPPADEGAAGQEYDISSAQFTVTLEQDVYIYDGKAKRPIVTVKKGETELLRGTDFTVKYENNINPGTATAIVKGDGEYSGTVEKTFTIQGKDISGPDFTVTLSETVYTYDGTEKKPAVTVMEGTEKLADSSFVVKYENNINPGTAKAIVTGTGVYMGTVAKEFTIEKKPSLDLSCKEVFTKKYGDKAFSLNASVKKGGSITYKSSDKKVVTVDKKGKVTIKGTGIAVITLTAKAAGYDNETLKVTVKVSPAKLAAPSLKTVKGRKLKVSWKKDKQATGYQIQCCTDKKFKKGVKSFQISKNKTVSKTIPKLAKGKQYYVRVRAYKSAKLNKKTQKLYGAWSGAKKSGKIKK